MNPVQITQTGMSSPVPSPAPDDVKHIPVHIPAPDGLPESDDLDRIMQDVGNELKKDDDGRAKRHRPLSFKRKSKREVNFSAQPIVPLSAPAPVSKPLPQPAAQHSLERTAGTYYRPAPAKPVAEPKASNSVPVFTIFVTSVVTVVLIAAAIAAYKK